MYQCPYLCLQVLTTSCSLGAAIQGTPAIPTLSADAYPIISGHLTCVSGRVRASHNPYSRSHGVFRPTVADRTLPIRTFGVSRDAVALFVSVSARRCIRLCRPILCGAIPGPTGTITIMATGDGCSTNCHATINTISLVSSSSTDHLSLFEKLLRATLA
jgi:hypothetical protein